MSQRLLRSRVLLRILRLGVAVYLGLIATLAAFQRSLIYHPMRVESAAMLKQSQLFQTEPWTDAAGQVIGWKRQRNGAPPAANRLVVFHGNTGYALERTHYIGGFERLDGGRLWQVYLFEYPGFGSRTGEISEASFVQAGAAAIAELLREDQRPIYLLGESLGSGLACATARQRANAVTGVLLITPFASMAETASYHYPTVPVSLILRDRWNNAAALKDFRGRVGVMIAGSDTVIPPPQGRRLFDAANEPKRLWIVPDADHNDFDFSPQAAWWGEASSFLLGEGAR